MQSKYAVQPSRSTSLPLFKVHLFFSSSSHFTSHSLSTHNGPDDTQGQQAHQGQSKYSRRRRFFFFWSTQDSNHHNNIIHHDSDALINFTNDDAGSTQAEEFGSVPVRDLVGREPAQEDCRLDRRCCRGPRPLDRRSWTILWYLFSFCRLSCIR